MATLLERVQMVVAGKLSLYESEVKPESSFTEDFNADSLDLVELIMGFEEEFGNDETPIEISDDDAESITTVQKVIDYLKDKGLKDGIPEYTPWPDPPPAIWDQSHSIHKFIKREGHANVASGHVEDGYELGAEISWIRKRFLDPYLYGMGWQYIPIHYVESLPGWKWEPQESNYEIGLPYIYQYVQRKRIDDLLIPWWRNMDGSASNDGVRVESGFGMPHIIDGFNIGEWFIQRQLDYKKNELSARQSSELENIEGWLWLNNVHYNPCDSDRNCRHFKPDGINEGPF